MLLAAAVGVLPAESAPVALAVKVTGPDPCARWPQVHFVELPGGSDTALVAGLRDCGVAPVAS